MSGHIFIVRGDIRHIACDAWLIPCSRRAAPDSFIPEHLQVLHPHGFPWKAPPKKDPWWKWGRRVLRAPSWPADEPPGWLVNIGYHPGAKQSLSEFYRASVQEALATVFRDLVSGTRFLLRRQVPLLVIPFLGGRLGMPVRDRGQLLRTLLELIKTEQDRCDRPVDVALVTLGSGPFAAAQQARFSLGLGWDPLNAELRVAAQELAEKATRGGLSLFFGAGVGVGAQLPTWNELLREIAQKAGMDRTATDNLLDARRDVRDQASYLEAELGDPEELHKIVVAIIGKHRHHYGLAHALLAGLPVREAITTNYDELFELAWDRAAAEPCLDGQGFAVETRTSIIPHGRQPGHDRWLLKLHGCVSRPDSIVLTRESYIRFSSQWAALEGILQATMLTRHMLFVGFSLRDDNFIRILDAVRRIVRPKKEPTPTSESFGTALMLGKDPVLKRLYQSDLNWTSMTERDELVMQPDDFQVAGRKLEIFLDCLLAHTRNLAHLLDPDFEDTLADDEKLLNRHLKQLAEIIPGGPERSPAWERVEELLAGFGRRNERVGLVTTRTRGVPHDRPQQ